jgi:hypothetical protein
MAVSVEKHTFDREEGIEVAKVRGFAAGARITFAERKSDFFEWSRSYAAIVGTLDGVYRKPMWGTEFLPASGAAFLTRLFGEKYVRVGGKAVTASRMSKVKRFESLRHDLYIPYQEIFTEPVDKTIKREEEGLLYGSV